MTPQRLWHLKSDALFGAPLTILAACDSAYLRYAPALLRSIDLFSPGFDFVLHVINPQHSDLAFCEALAKSVSATSVSVSYEADEGLSGKAHQTQKAYFASCRFMVAANLLADAGCPILCIDVDSVFINPIDMIFGQAGSDVALVRRDDNDLGRPDHLKVAAGVVVYFPTESGRLFASELARRLTQHFQTGAAAWFIDQLTIFKLMTEMQDTVRIASLKAKYADFQLYKLNSVIWSAKGDNKEFLEPFVSLQKVLCDSPYEQVQGKHVLNRAMQRSPDGKVNLFYAARPALRLRLPRSGTIFVPRADLSMDESCASPPLPVDDQAVQRHLKTQEFVTYLANRLEIRGILVEVIELPFREITPDHVNANSGDFAIIPDMCRAHLSDLTIPAAVYGRYGLPETFTLDFNSSTPDLPSKYPESRRAWTAYRKRLINGKLQSQRGLSDEEIMADGARYDIFFPLRFPGDTGAESAQMALVESLARFAKGAGLSLVLKPHPASAKTDTYLDALADKRHVFVSRRSLHALIDSSRMFFTNDDDMGFEAMLHDKPIAAFGPSVRRPPMIAGQADDIVATWAACLEAEGKVDCSGFFEWFCEIAAIDLSRPSSRDASLDRYTETLIRTVYSL